MHKEKNQPISIEELRKSIPKIKNANTAHAEKLSPIDKIATWVTDHVGSIGFFLLIFIWTIFWLIWNMIAPISFRFDPYPAFVLWLFISNMIQLFLLPLLLIGQNLQDKVNETQAEIEFEMSIKTEKEIEAIFSHLEHQNRLLGEINSKLRSKPSKKSVKQKSAR